MSDKLNHEEMEIKTPFNAIAKAVKESIWTQTKTKLGMPGFYYEDGKLPKSLKEAVRVGTSGMCAIGSENVIHTLATKHSNLFSKMVLISTDLVPKDSPLNHGLSENDQQFHHSYFLVQDNYGVWYAGSPANHHQMKDKDYSLTVITSRDLTEVIEKMEKRDLAKYPTAEDIELNSKNAVSVPTNLKNQVNIFEIRKTKLGLETQNHQFSPNG